MVSTLQVTLAVPFQVLPCCKNFCAWCKNGVINSMFTAGPLDRNATSAWQRILMDFSSQKRFFLDVTHVDNGEITNLAIYYSGANWSNVLCKTQKGIVSNIEKN